LVRADLINLQLFLPICNLPKLYVVNMMSIK